MEKDIRSKYAGRDLMILDQHAADTIEEDYKTFPMQLNDHLAHVLMLTEQEIIAKEDGAKLLETLLKLEIAGPRSVPLKEGLTDLYSNIEEWVIGEIGLETGGKLHTGRSRNDMNLSIERMYMREAILEFAEALLFLMDTLLLEADAHKETIIPGYTHHSQHAQPITLGHFYMGAFSAFVRDAERLLAAYSRTNLSPMGSAAIAATGFPVNRERVAELLGFDGVIINSLDAACSLDFAYETAGAMSIFINNVGRIVESLLLWNIREVGIARLDLKYCSYSTIMPQKRNPVALETLRYSAEWTYGTLSTMFNTLKAYTPGNGREPGFVASLGFEIAEKITRSTYLLEGILRTMEVDKEKSLQITKEGFGTMTDLADEMVKSMGLSFSAAKKIVGRLVVIAVEDKVPCEEIDSALVERAAKEALDLELTMPEELIRCALDPVENVNRRDVTGGPSPAQVAAMIADGRMRLNSLQKQRRELENSLAEMSQRLRDLAAGQIQEVRDGNTQ